MNKKGILKTFLLITLLASSCSFLKKSSNYLPGVSIALGEMNKSFQIEDSPVDNDSYKNGGILFLEVHNLSDKTIVFPQDYGLRLFYLKDITQNIIQNKFSYSEFENTLPTRISYPLA